MKKPHSPVDAQVFPGHKIDLFADIEIQDTSEFNNNHTAYRSLVPRDDEPSEDTVFEHKLEKHAPSPEATKELPKLTGSETMAPI